MNPIKYIIIVSLLHWTIDTISQSSKSTFNFGFENNINDSINNDWQLLCDGYNDIFDTTEHVEGERSIKFERGGLNPVLDLCLFQKILLPGPAHKIFVSLFSKSLNFKCAWLIIAGFNKKGEIIVTDTISVIDNNGWKKFTASIEHDGIYLLSIEIRAKEPFAGLKTKVHLWIDNITVDCDGQNLLSVEPPPFEPANREINEIAKNIPLDTSLILPETVLKKISMKRIIGFGETAHGSLDIDRFKYYNIRQLVLKYNCRLVLLEMPIDFAAQYDLYINGYTVDSVYTKFMPPYTKIDTIYEKISFLSPELESFMNWLKDYNNTHEDKVRVVGIDRLMFPFSPNEAPPFLNRYISSMKLNSRTVDSLVCLSNSGLCHSMPLQYALKNKKELSDLMGNFNYTVLMQILKNRTDSSDLYNPIFPYWSEWQYAYRDYIMWQNTKEILERFVDNNSTVAVCAHYGHLNKNTFIHFNEVIPLGQYLAETYVNDYYHIGVLLGEGEVGCREDNTKGLAIQKLQSPIQGSLEYFALLTNQDAFFREGFIKSSKPLLIRRSGDKKSTNQFIPAYFPGCMDGFVFLRKSTTYIHE